MTFLALMIVFIVANLVFVVALIFCLHQVCFVKQSTKVVTEKFGAYARTLGTGFHYLSLFEKPVEFKQFDYVSTDGKIIVRKEKYIDLKEQFFHLDPIESITKENAIVTVYASVFFIITDPFAYYSKAQNHYDLIRRIAVSTCRAKIAELNLSNLVCSNETISEDLRQEIEKASNEWGMKILRVTIENVKLPSGIRDAMVTCLAREFEKRAKIIQGSAIKESKIIVSQGEKESYILKSLGTKEASILGAEGLKQSKILDGEALKESTVIVSEGKASEILNIKKAEANGILAIKSAEAFGYKQISNVKIDSNILSLCGFETINNLSNSRADLVYIPNEMSSFVSASSFIGNELHDSEIYDSIKNSHIFFGNNDFLNI